MEPREWAGYGTRGVTTPARRSVRVMGYAQHPGGVASVEIDGRPAAIAREATGNVRFVGFVAADSGSREVAVTVRGQSGLPVVRHFPLNGDPAARPFASREEPWTPSAGFRGKRWAVVVGVSAYQDSTIRPLRFADDDAQAFYEFLRSPRAGGGGFAEENVKLLLNEGATFAEVRTALMSFLRQATPEDQVVIYFAGHGEPDPLRPGDLYLLTHDTRFAQISSTAFPMRDLQRAVEELSAKHVLLITDACHSGGVTGQHLATRGSANQINQAFLAQLSASTGGLAVFTASQASQPSLEDERWGGGHGVFTYYLLEALKGGADEDGDQIVTLVDAMHWTTERVRRETGNAQVPVIGNHTYDMYLPVAMVLRDDEAAPKPETVVTEPGTIAGQGPATGGGAEKRTVPPALADSLAHARRAAETFPNSALYRSALGRLLVRVGSTEEGIAAFREAIRLDPQNPEFHAALARSLGEAKLVRESLEAWERAVALAPQSAAFQHESGDALLQAGQTDAALERLRRAVRMDGSQAAYHGSLGRGLRAAARAREAVAVLKTAVTLDAASPEHRRELAQALAEDGRIAEGIAELQEAARLAPADAAVRAELAAVLRNAGRLPEARAALAEAVRLDSADAGYRSALGRVLQESGLKYEATLEFRAAVRLDPKNARHHYALGTLLVGSNEQAAALAALEETVRLEPANALYHNALGVALRAATRPAEALQALMQAVALEPTEPRYHFDLGTMYAETGSYPQALASLQAATRLARDNAEYQAALRDVQRRLRK
ncbi:MAG TPA: tetratricopeptide repeat protein [Longimicrobium sp.]|nr:tetratricopeptide repeat protein [Longimicrobium sp.]